MTTPLLSIVIANYNYGRFLESAIRSVGTQGVEGKIELIICDGGSSDNSVEIIKKYSNGLPPNMSYYEWSEAAKVSNSKAPNNQLITWWCSEKDGGQSSAFNKGFSHAKGKYLTWLNADDIYMDGCLRKVISEMEQHPECKWFTANMLRFLDDGTIFEAPWGPHYLPGWLQGNGRPVSVYGPSSFFAKDIFERAGQMKEYQHFMMDTDLWMRFILLGVKQLRINCFCWAFRMHCDSKTAEFGEHKIPKEKRQQFEEERVRSLQETGYRLSKFNRYALLLWRVIDGSFIKYMYIKATLKNVKDLI